MKVVFRGGGDLASAVAHKLFKAGFQIVMLELEHPLVIRRTVSFASAIIDGTAQVEDVKAVRLDNVEALNHLQKDLVYVTTLPEAQIMSAYQPDVFIDATLSKKAVNYRIGYADLVIGLGPEIVAGKDADFVIETNRGHHLGCIITEGKAAANTGEPGVIAGFTRERVHYSHVGGTFKVLKDIGEKVEKGEAIAMIGDTLECANISGVVRGMLKGGHHVEKNTKIADVDPRGDVSYCYTITDKGRNIAGAVLEAIMRRYNHDGKF